MYNEFAYIVVNPEDDVREKFMAVMKKKYGDITVLHDESGVKDRLYCQYFCVGKTHYLVSNEYLPSDIESIIESYPTYMLIDYNSSNNGVISGKFNDVTYFVSEGSEIELGQGLTHLDVFPYVMEYFKKHLKMLHNYNLQKFEEFIKHPNEVSLPYEDYGIVYMVTGNMIFPGQMMNESVEKEYWQYSEAST